LGQLEDDKIYDEESQSYQFIGDYITIEDFHLGLLSAASLAFKQKDYRKTLIFCNKSLYEYQNCPEDTYFLQNLFIDPLTIRLRVHMIQDEEAFKKDFELLKSKVEPEVLMMDKFREIIEYSEKIGMV
jgi:hypothetical protein